MNKGADNRHEEFVERVGEALNSRAEALDGATRSRLNRARQSALATQSEISLSRTARRNWMPAGGVAMVALFVAVILVDGYQLGRPSGRRDAAVPTDTRQMFIPTAGDLEVLTVDEDLEMLNDLDFYNWLQSVPVSSGAGLRSKGLG